MISAEINQKRIRKYYGKIREVANMPNLIEVQRSSYDLFLKSGNTNGLSPFGVILPTNISFGPTSAPM